MTLARPEPCFLDGSLGRLFALHQRAEGEVRRLLLCVPPFAEEGNRCRRALAATMRTAARAGSAALLVDPYGTGDSGGDFADADWCAWRADLDAARAFLEAAYPNKPLDVLAVRAGASLASEWLANGARCARLVLWQPVVNGKQHLQQFMRLRVMAARFAGREESVAGLRARLNVAGAIEVAGYMLPRAVAEGLERARLEALVPLGADAAEAIEVGAQPPAHASPALGRVLEAWRERGLPVRWRGLAEEPCWATQEIAESPSLVRATAEILADDA